MMNPLVSLFFLKIELTDSYMKQSASKKNEVVYSDEDYISFFKFLDEIVEIIDEEEKTQHQSKLKN